MAIRWYFYRRIILYMLLVIAAVAQLRFAFQEQLQFSDNTERLADERIRNPRVLLNFAKQKHLFEADLDGAQRLFRQALICSPLYVPAWLGLAELLNDRGDKKRAAAIVTYADSLTRNINRWRWDKTLTAYQLGLTDLLPAELRYIIAHIPGKSRTDALKLAFTLWPDPTTLLTQIGTENLLHLFNHAVRTNRPQEALTFWHHLTQSPIAPDDRQIVAFIEMLLRTDHVAEAVPIWRQHFNDQNTIFNPDFKSRPLGRAFGWRLTDHKGVDQRFEPLPQPGSHAIQLRFKGWENLSYHHLLQIVPLEPQNDYRFTVQMKADKLTTDQRPFWEVYGYKCQAPRTTSEMVATNQDWTEHTIDFHVPSNCSAMVVRLRRQESTMLDNKISGRLWIRQPIITPVESHPFQPQQEGL
ncbi:tetratricopeptide repeat protein [bacterium]|nr:tetratricopeptide repeat protein [bacterium]